MVVTDAASRAPVELFLAEPRQVNAPDHSGCRYFAASRTCAIAARA
jgi:hypothetical protein